jgi:hypothetical protein
MTPQPPAGGGEQLGDRLVARRGQQVREGDDLLVGEALRRAVLAGQLGLGEGRHEVVPGPAPALGEAGTEVLEEPAQGFEGDGRRRGLSGLAVQDRVRPAAHGVSVLFRNAEQRADHVHGQLRGELLHDVETRASGHRIQVPAGDLADAGLEGSDAPGREDPGDEAAHARVPRRIHEDHDGRQRRKIHQLEHRAARRAVGERVEERGQAVVEARQGPEALRVRVA